METKEGKKRLVVASRASRLAIVQAEGLVAFLRKKYPEKEIVLQFMKTTGDKLQNVSLDQVGGKGLFVKELEQALRDGTVDFAVHSLKDVPMEVPEDLPLLAFSKREDPRDVLVLPKCKTEPDLHLPVGTSSLRRSLQFSALYPDWPTETIRGNVQTRLKKLDDGQYGALVLAAAGLKRLGLEARISRFFSIDEMLPAAGQGILVVQGRAGEDYGLLEGYGSCASALQAMCERAYVRTVNGGCSSPDCAHATIEGQNILLKALHFDAASGLHIGSLEGTLSQAEDIGRRLAEKLLENG